MKTPPTLDRILRKHHYDKHLGRLFRRYVGGRVDFDKARRFNRDGYPVVTVDYECYAEHNVIWFLEKGVWPSNVLDHINGDKKDNRIENLRESSNALNAQNRFRASANKAFGLPIGVYKKGSKFFSTICVDGKKYDLGVHDTPEKASDAYWEAKSRLAPHCTKPDEDNYNIFG